MDNLLQATAGQADDRTAEAHEPSKGKDGMRFFKTRLALSAALLLGVWGFFAAGLHVPGTPRDAEARKLRQKLSGYESQIPALEAQVEQDRIGLARAERPANGKGPAIAEWESRLERWRAIARKSEERLISTRKAILDTEIRIREVESGIEREEP